MNAFGGSGRDDQIPGGLQDSAWAERLPKPHIEVPAGRTAADEALHDYAGQPLLYYDKQLRSRFHRRFPSLAGNFVSDAGFQFSWSASCSKWSI